MPQSLGFLILALVALGAHAGAQGAGGAAFTDAALDAMPPTANAYADLVAGKAELVDGDMVLATIELGPLPEVQPGIAYIFLISDDDGTAFGALASAPEPEYLYGRWVDGGPTSADETTGSVSVGPRGLITIEIPLTAFAGARLTAPAALTADIKLGASPIGTPLGDFVLLDEAQGEGELLLPQTPPEEEGGAAAQATPGADAPPAATTAAPEPPTAGGNETPALPFLMVIAAMLFAARLLRR